ncbi:MAG TPA: DUF4129 domain-containing protein [Candidatus Acidoferrum sp.]|jgi:hypothetical protein|nr:DUF4129 domain-containing protein [Candidatus Acidoferrum sp.]
MKPNARRLRGKASLELLEEAFHLLRSAPTTALASYYLGALPFVLGSFWFWADMSRSPFAYQHLDAAALGLAVLFLWMKCWHVLYVRALRDSIAGGLPPLSPGAVWRIVVTQAAMQPTGLFLLPLALVPVLPFPYVFAFYQNLTVLASGESAGFGALAKRAARQSSLWPRQNSALVVVMFGFGLIVFLNWATFCFLLPGLIKMLFGVESVFTRSGMSMLNTTFFAAMFGLTYLCVDPLVKAAYCLRCFYGESLVSGEDLKAELRQFAPSGAAQQVALCLLLALSSAAWGSEPEGVARCPQRAAAPHRVTASSQHSEPLLAKLLEGLEDPAEAGAPLSHRRDAMSAAVENRNQTARSVWRAWSLLPLSDRPVAFDSAGKLDALENGPATPAPGADPGTLKQKSSQDAAPAFSAPELDRTIQEVIQQRKYTWRMPREKIVKPEAEQKGIIGRFFERVGELLRRGLKAMWDGLDSLLRRLFQGRKSTNYDGSGYGWIFLLQLLPYLLIAAVAAALGFLLYRLWLSRRRPAAAIAGEPIQLAPDLSDENVGAEQLREDGWSKLARELLAQGELRLAMRAFYLASLAHLSQRNLISLARFKSNRDYERELHRRGHSFPELLAVFSENVSVFERIWYGMHEVSGELVTQFAAKVERIRSGAC